MKSSTVKNYLSTLVFIILYSIFVFKASFTVADYSDIIVGTTFFFTLFIGFFITRQNDRYSAINDQLTSTDGYFSYLYRVTGLVPRIQKEVKDIVREHYMKIKETNNPAYHVMNPSNSISKMTAVLSSITEEEAGEKAATDGAWQFLFEVISDLQLLRKKTLNLYEEKLVPFQWLIVYILGILLVISFDFVPATFLLVDILKIFFGTAVFISIILLRQLDDLTLFGTTIGMQSVEDTFRIVDEKDAAELAKK
jgi:hypothetical protein